VDLIDKLKELSNRIERQRDSVLTEQAAKTAFVLPFLQALGYDVFNPSEVIPELTADHGVKKGEKVDYAIKLDDKIIILIECKPLGSTLNAKCASQLFRYFSVTDARFSILTDGVRYLFFSDLESQNKMDERPFLEFNILQFTDSDVDELKKFSKSTFNLESILSRASTLKYHKALLAEIRTEFENPSEDLVRLLTSRVYEGRFTQQIKEQFTSLTHSALRDFIRERINERLQSALDTDKQDFATATENHISADDDGIETTAEELEAFRIIQAIGSEVVDVDRIYIRDAKSYCAILLDNNNRRPICRLHFGKTRMAVSIFALRGETKIELEKISQLYKYRGLLHESILQYEPKNDAQIDGLIRQTIQGIEPPPCDWS
jgi:hypothetical protein